MLLSIVIFPAAGITRAMQPAKQIRNPNIESGPADRNQPQMAKSEIRSTKEAPRTETNRGPNKSKIRKIQNEESELGLFGTLHLF
jgi:hypothetical protein